MKTLKRLMIVCMALALVCMTAPLGNTQEVTTPKFPCAKCGEVTTVGQSSYAKASTIYRGGFPVDSKAAARMLEWGAITSETIDLLGSPVINPAGKTLGTINAFVNDSEGHVAFVILWRGVLEDFKAARYLAVPFRALSITRMGPAKVNVVLNMEKGAMDSAPSFDRTNDLKNTESAARIYRYFGQTPHWTEEAAGKHVQP